MGIIQEEGYQIFNVTDGYYEGGYSSFITSMENAHKKLLEFTRLYCYRGKEFEVHKFTITGLKTEVIEKRKSKYGNEE